MEKFCSETLDFEVFTVFSASHPPKRLAEPEAWVERQVASVLSGETMTVGLRSIPPQLQWPLCLRCAVFATHVLLLRIGLINCTFKISPGWRVHRYWWVWSQALGQKWLKRQDVVGFRTEAEDQEGDQIPVLPSWWQGWAKCQQGLAELQHSATHKTQIYRSMDVLSLGPVGCWNHWQVETACHATWHRTSKRTSRRRVFKRLEAEATHEPTGIHFFVTQERQVRTKGSSQKIQ